MCTMDHTEYTQFIADIKLAHVLERDDVNEIFYLANFASMWEKRQAGMRSATDGQDVVLQKNQSVLMVCSEDIENNDAEMTSFEFVNALLRLAVLLDSKREPASAKTAIAAQDGAGPSIVQRLDYLVLEHMSQYAERASNNEFLTIMKSEAVRNVMRKHREPLTKIFRFYAAASSKDDGKKKVSVSLQDMETLVKDCSLHDPVLSMRTTKILFQSVQVRFIPSNLECLSHHAR